MWAREGSTEAVCQAGWQWKGVWGRECTLQQIPAGYPPHSCMAILSPLAPLSDLICQMYLMNRSNIRLIQWCQWHSVVAVGQPKISQHWKVCEAPRNGKKTRALLLKHEMYLILANSSSWTLDVIAISLLSRVQIIPSMHRTKPGCVGKSECTLEVLED